MMPFHACFEYLASRRTDELVVTAAGNTSEMWWEVTQQTDGAFYLQASMGMASVFAAGIALGVPTIPVWVFSGDGSFCMNPGALMVERQLNLPNLTHFLVSNRCYGSTYESPLPNVGFSDYEAVARGFGIERVFRFDSLDDLRRDFDRVVRGGGPSLVVLEVEPVGRKLHEAPIEGPDLKYRFGRAVERAAGIRVFGFD